MIFRRPSYFLLFPILLATSLIITGCSKGNHTNVDPVYTDPLPFPELTENNTGFRCRSITYVYDRRAVDASYPPKIDSSVIRFAYDSITNLITRIRFTHNDFIVYDYSFEREPSQKLKAIHCKSWIIKPVVEIDQNDLALEYNASGYPSLLKATVQNDPLHEVDSFIIKSTSWRIDTVIDRTFAVGTNADKYAFTYTGAYDIIRMDKIHTFGAMWSVEQIYWYTLSGAPPPIILGNEGIIWNFFAHHTVSSPNTAFVIPAILFHSTSQPSKLVLQESGFYTGTYNYQTEYYGTGMPKKMTANVITQTGAFYAREAYYYSYAQ